MTRALLRPEAHFATAYGVGRGPKRFHATIPGYVPTPLHDLPDLAEQLGIQRLLVKDESNRLGLPAFKILGASWAIVRAIADRSDSDIASFDELRARVEELQPLALTAATEGNHGRAVARMARLLGLPARIFVPRGTSLARIESIQNEGADVDVVVGGYDDAVRRAVAEAGERVLVISDTSWPGYERIPRAVTDGYATIFWEIEDELERRGQPPPDVVFVQIGVGALAAAIVGHFRRLEIPHHPAIVGVEPKTAACVLESVARGQITTLTEPQDSIMAGLNCGTPSYVAWPAVSTGIDLYLAIPDDRARDAMRVLARAGIIAGETGAAGLAGLLALLEEDDLAEARDVVSFGSGSSVLVIVTEGTTDLDAYRAITGSKALA